MKTYARVVGGKTVDTKVTTLLGLGEMFHPTIVEQFIEVPNGTVDGAEVVEGVWTNPVNEVVEPTAVLPAMSPMQFYLAFTVGEMIAIKGSTDPVVQEVYARYQIALQTGTPINPQLPSVKNGLEYLATAGACIDAARIPDILLGIPQ